MKIEDWRTANLGDLVDPEMGWVSREIFVSPEIHRLEMERLFLRSWLFVGHESEVPRPGDYVTRQMGDDPVIVARDKDDRLHVFLNACPHRGAMLCRADEGNKMAFQCAYHGWTFGNDGALVTVADQFDDYRGRVDFNDYRLVEARVGTYAGCIFATFDDELMDLDSYLGDSRWYIDMFFAKTPGGVEVLGAPLRWQAQKNWKYGAVNFAADGPHALAVHGPVTQYIVGGETFPREELLRIAKTGPAIRMDNGHGGIFIDGPEGAPPWFGFDPELVETYRRTLNENQIKLMEHMFNGVFTIFPNMSWVHFPISFSEQQYPAMFFNLRTWQPTAADRTQIWNWFLVDKEAADWYKEASLRAGVQTFTAAGTFDQDDAEAWAAINNGSKGTIGRRQRSSYQMILASEEDHIADFPGPGRAYASTYSEMSEFGIFLEWRKRMMQAG